MRSFIAAAALLLLCGCEPAPHDFPAAAQAQFNRTCPASDAVCSCTWDKITRAMTAEDYAAAVARFRREGLMDPHITHARTVCVEAHPHH